MGLSDLTVLDYGQKEVHSGEVSPFSGDTRRANLFCFACSQVPVLDRDHDSLQERMGTPGPAFLQAPRGSHIAEICPSPLTDPVVVNPQDPPHGTY